MGLNMVEKEPISELVSRQQKLSDRLEKKGNLFGGTIPAKIAELDPWTQTDKLLKLGRAGAWLERSILEVQQSLVSNIEEINIRKGELLGKAQIYQGELEQRRIQLAKMEGLSTIPATSIAEFKARLAQLESKKDEDPELKLGFQFLQEQPAPPAPPAAPVETPPAEPTNEISEEKKLTSVEFDKVNRTLTLGGVIHHLTRREVIVVNLLYQAQEQLVASSIIRESLSNADFMSEPGQVIANLKRKLGKEVNDVIEHQGPNGSAALWMLHRKIAKKVAPVEKTAEHITQITFNPDNNEFIKDGKVIDISKYYKAIIRYLAENPGKHPITDLYQVLKDAGSKVKIDNTNAYTNDLLTKKKITENDLNELIQVTRKEKSRANLYNLSSEYAVTILSAAPKPGDKPPVPPVETPAKPEDREVLVAPIAYKFDPEARTLQIGSKKVTLTEGRFAILNFLYVNLGHYINSDTLDGTLARLGSNSKTAQILLDIRKSLGIKDVPLFSVIREGKGGSAKYALGISPDEIETSATGEVKAKIPRRAGREMTQLPEGEEIELSSYKARLVQYLNSSKAEALDTTSIINHIWPEDNKPMKRKLDNLQKLIRDTNIELELRRWKIVNAAGGRGHKAKYYLEKIQTQISPEQQEEITQLEQSLTSLLASRPTIAEAASLGLPGNHAADLEQLDILVTQKQDRLRQLGQA